VRDAFVARLILEAQADPRVMLVTGDLGFGVLTKFEAALPGQFLNAGVAEQNMTMLATGLAMEGRIVFTYSIANFPILRCLEMIRNDAAYHGANVKVVSIGGGFSYGALGISHHATEDIAVMRSMPDVTVVAPGDVWEAEEATSALVRTPGTCYLRLDKSAAPTATAPGERFVLGQARTLRQGSDLTVVGCGGILGEALVAAGRLAGHGVEARVLSLHTLKPIDRDAILAAARETGGIVSTPWTAGSARRSPRYWPTPSAGRGASGGSGSGPASAVSSGARNTCGRSMAWTPTLSSRRASRWPKGGPW
jgi:transketolase